MKILCRIVGHKYVEDRSKALIIRSLDLQPCRRCGYKEELRNLVPVEIYKELIEAAKHPSMFILYWK